MLVGAAATLVITGCVRRSEYDKLYAEKEEQARKLVAERDDVARKLEAERDQVTRRLSSERDELARRLATVDNQTKELIASKLDACEAQSKERTERLERLADERARAERVSGRLDVLRSVTVSGTPTTDGWILKDHYYTFVVDVYGMKIAIKVETDHAEPPALQMLSVVADIGAMAIKH
ncbi:MAG: hypothetical protein QM820_23690 [Minicystis sp.]